ncbi:MAG: Biotin carboxylase of acetyl-CoA carboxylase [uncultured Thermomicrobiales bacterium]|uniref:Biotin carboxylase of acetyl-CoA carboxylase n=1 Tax=uncultured Thermomicrobiales bacterium TaxID=1645740 RepID=A0A6J4VWT5_9BACT|nr:MAG: Biotin carboxylase of acetyl-CoA carboxylase [uncultured Thermomicrobiales bacterium]
MFRTVLIANRGEIAIRIGRACRELGLATVAIYGEEERDAPHARYADAAFVIEAGEATRPYLNGPGLLAIARRAGAEAIHPGYGFLAENAEFARAVLDAGLIWIGPAPDAIAAMGDKIAARKLAGEAGVPLVPGTNAAVATPEEAAALGAGWGFPLALKAAGGGGGRGFRVARTAAEVPDAFAAAAGEGQRFFNNPTLYAEKYIEAPKHVEIQILADRHGGVIHLGERECSTQRRHQKLIEEAPSPAVDADLRARMGAAATALARAVSYEGAGTLEFLLDADKNFYFMEMNTRIQVEHTVTEEVTGIDLVKAQLRIAAGEPLPWRQEEIALRGHAIECRINAEDPARGFAPTPGTITEYKEPGGAGIRIDGAAERGFVISPSYDSMIAKLIARGSDRGEAIARMRRALGEYLIGGVASTIPFHQAVLAHPVFVEGRAATDWIERDGVGRDLPPAELPPAAEDTPAPQAREYTLEVNGKRFAVRLFADADPAASPPNGARPATSRQRATPKGGGKAAGGGDGALISPIQGTVLRVAVEEGAAVKAGALICVVEAMKMENEIAAPRDGTVRDLAVATGETIKIGAKIATIA